MANWYVRANLESVLKSAQQALVQENPDPCSQVKQWEQQYESVQGWMQRILLYLKQRKDPYLINMYKQYKKTRDKLLMWLEMCNKPGQKQHWNRLDANQTGKEMF